jgi:hypothetical protein
MAKRGEREGSDRGGPDVVEHGNPLFRDHLGGRIKPGRASVESVPKDRMMLGREEQVRYC